jgi:hypothetical protein
MIKGNTDISVPGGVVTMDHIISTFTLSADFTIDSYDVKHESIATQPICSTKATSSKDFILIKTADTELMITLEHKVYLPAEDTWAFARDLKSGSILLSHNSGPVEVVEVLRVRDKASIRVYTLSLAEHCNYFANNILIHSQMGGDCDI